jgi:UDP-N-acetylglucosamine--N-acetylmuramyl-(pentapeptide) pyrophosphoryl-undecaprenol N-acetylglucosamine transferase
MNPPTPLAQIAIACGGTGGHLFPGLALAEVFQQWGCEVTLLVSRKEVDQEAVKAAVDLRILTLPAVALQNRNVAGFIRGCWQSYRICRHAFQTLRPQAVLAMGGFTSAPPIVAGIRCHASTFLHESNAIPGRANRWLSPWVDEIFVGFPTAAHRLYHQSVHVLGTPVRAQFRPTDPSPCRMALGLRPDQPVLLVMGGSQGAAGINRLLETALPLLNERAPELQYIHLTGAEDARRLQTAYAAQRCRAVVRPFLTEMELALEAATVAVNRAGASSIAELAAVQLPAILIPYPHATDDHQLFNARALAESGAAELMPQAAANPEALVRTILRLLSEPAARDAMKRALAQWHFPHAAEDIAGHVFAKLGLLKPAGLSSEGTYTLGQVLRRSQSQSDVGRALIGVTSTKS